MMKTITMKGLACILLVIFAGSAMHAQRHKNGVVTFGKQNVQGTGGIIPCASTEYEAYLKKKNPNRLSADGFEDWLAPKIKQARNLKNTNTVVTIPVVVHIIHDGDAVGIHENIPDAQVFSQIEVLNQDFRRMLGTPGHNSHPDGADIEIEFCLAQQDPDGLPTNGINRVNLGFSSLDFATMESIMKPQTQWDPERYLNIWVCVIGGDMEGVGGYAFFPEASGLPGLEGSESTASNDGVVMHPWAFGSADIYPAADYFPNFNKGRSCVHELGHFFGLRHIWGDEGNCNATDYCNDTPAAVNMNTACNTIDSCPANPGNDMIENYMDYTPDACKNIFTNDQKARMMAVLQNSPRRGSLTASNACQVPQPLNLDASLKIKEINAGCSEINPVITIFNVGTTTLTSATISYTIDNGPEHIINWTGSLVTYSSAEINLNELTVLPGEHVFSINLISANNTTDDYAGNNLKTSSFQIAENFTTSNVAFSLQLDAYGSDTTWNIKNSAGTTLYSGGPYADGTPQLITQTWNLPDNDCYTFTINDAFGDGICCSPITGNGYYNLKTDNNILIAEGGQFSSASEKKMFSKNLVLGTVQHSQNNFNVYPNPVNDVLNIVYNENSSPDEYIIYNMLGEKIRFGSFRQESDYSIDTSDFAKGIYIIQLSNDYQTKTLKFIKE